MSDYVPNKVPKNKRVFGLIWSVFLITYGAYSYLNGQLWIPGIGASSGIIFHGKSLILVIVAIGLSCCNLLLPLLDHIDKRDNETLHSKLGKFFNILSVVLIIVASLIAHNFSHHTKQYAAFADNTSADSAHKFIKLDELSQVYFPAYQDLYECESFTDTQSVLAIVSDHSLYVYSAPLPSTPDYINLFWSQIESVEQWKALPDIDLKNLLTLVEPRNKLSHNSEISIWDTADDNRSIIFLNNALGLIVIDIIPIDFVPATSPDCESMTRDVGVDKLEKFFLDYSLK